MPTILKTPAETTISPEELETKTTLDLEKIEDKLSSLGGDVAVNDIRLIFSINNSRLNGERDIFVDLATKGETESSQNVAKLSSIFSRANSVDRIKSKRKELLNDVIENVFVANKNLVQKMNSDSIKNAKKIIQKYKSEFILNDLKIEPVSKELKRLLGIRSPLTYDPLIAEGLINSQKNFFNFIENQESDLMSMTIGLPSGMIEKLRRNSNQFFENSNQGYIEIEVSSRHLIFEELVFEPIVFNFPINVSSIVENSNPNSPNLKESIESLEFECFEREKWNTKNLERTLQFISIDSGLDLDSSKALLYNQAISDLIDSIYRLFAGIDLKKLGNEYQDIITNNQIQNVRNTISIVSSDSLEDITTKNQENLFVVNSIPSINPSSTIDEADFRILSSLASDPVFTYESTYSPTNKMPLFERSFSVLFDPYEFEINREKSEKSIIESLEKRGRIFAASITGNPRQTGRQIYLSKNASQNELDAFQYAATIKLVRK